MNERPPKKPKMDISFLLGETPNEEDIPKVDESTQKNNIPKAIGDFYQAINADHYNHEEVTKILDRLQLALVKGQEKSFSENQFQRYHEHCFQTPLLAICHIASQHSTAITDEQLSEIITRLIKLGADITKKDELGSTPLLLLASSVKERPHLIKSIKLLLQHGAVISEQNDSGKTVLHQAYNAENFELAHHLLDLNATVLADEDDQSFLMELTEADINTVKQQLHLIKSLLTKLHLLSQVPEKDDSLYTFLKSETDINKGTALETLLEQDPPLSEHTLKFAFENLAEDDEFDILLHHMDKKLISMYSKLNKEEVNPTIHTPRSDSPLFFGGESKSTTDPSDKTEIDHIKSTSRK